MREEIVPDLLPPYSALLLSLAAFKRLAARDADFETLVLKARALTRGFAQATPVLDQRHKIFRGVAWADRPVQVAQLSFPPPHFVSGYGRAHKPSTPMFYGSVARSAPFYELRATPGLHLVISRWGFTDRVLFNNVGYADVVLKKHKTTRQGTAWWHEQSSAHSAFRRPGNKLILRFLADAFSRDVGGADSQQYKTSAAITEALIGANVTFGGWENVAPPLKRFGGLIYPSLAMRCNSDNVAIFPEVVEQFMRIEQAEYIRVDAVDDGAFSYQITELDFANSFSSDGVIEWKGRIGQWNVPPGRAYRLAVEDGQFIARDERGEIVDRE